LLLAHPELSRLITDEIGDGWVTDLAQLRRLLPRLALPRRGQSTNQPVRDLSSVWRLRNVSRSLREAGTARTADGI
jgi:hypothetical protein